MATDGISKLTKLPAVAFAIAAAATAVISLAATFFSAADGDQGFCLLAFKSSKLLSRLLRRKQHRSGVGGLEPNRNGTPRQPLVVPLSRACLVFDSSLVPADALDGLADYSHCWILFVFHLNTDLEKLWKQPSRSKFKAKVRVPRLEGAKMGVLATRSPHRPCPIGLSVAKIEALEGHALMLSGVDLVDGTPVLDVKPYLPYSDSIQGATIPKWLKAENAFVVSSISFSAEFNSTLSICWSENEKISLYASMESFRSLIKEVLSCDIRSLSQRCRPHQVIIKGENPRCSSLSSVSSDSEPTDVIYHLVLERVDISYRIDERLNIMVEKATLVSGANSASKHRYNYSTWREKPLKIDSIP